MKRTEKRWAVMLRSGNLYTEPQCGIVVGGKNAALTGCDTTKGDSIVRVTLTWDDGTPPRQTRRGQR